MMRHWREREFERDLTPATLRYGLRLWAFFAQAAGALPRGDAIAMARSALLGARQAAASAVCRSPAAGRRSRDMPAPERATFMDQWRKRSRNG